MPRLMCSKRIPHAQLLFKKNFFLTPSKVRLFPTGKTPPNLLSKTTAVSCSLKICRTNCKSHSHLFPRFKGFAAIRDVLYLLQLFALVSKIQNNQIQNIEPFHRIKGNANILHSHTLKPPMFMQKLSDTQNPVKCIKTYCKGFILMCR